MNTCTYPWVYACEYPAMLQGVVKVIPRLLEWPEVNIMHSVKLSIGKLFIVQKKTLSRCSCIRQQSLLDIRGDDSD